MDPPCSTRVSRARVYSWAGQFTTTGLSPSVARHSNASFDSWFVRFRSPLLTELRLLSFPAVTEMFHFSAFALCSYTFRTKYPEGWVAPFGNLRITVCLPTPLSVSPVTASFIASRHQVIHHAPLLGHTNRLSKTRANSSFDSFLLAVDPVGCFPRSVHFTTSYRCFNLTSDLPPLRATQLPSDFHCGSNSLSAL